VLMVDDVLATGGTMRACCNLIEELGGEVAGCTFLIELAFLKGRQKLDKYRVHAVVVCDE
jgi:adenine phosphoribosyltransferase